MATTFSNQDRSKDYSCCWNHWAAGVIVAKRVWCDTADELDLFCFKIERHPGFVQFTMIAVPNEGRTILAVG